jgi:hypothetical protein
MSRSRYPLFEESIKGWTSVPFWSFGEEKTSMSVPGIELRLVSL